jgi:hypothetical protein
MKTKYFLTLVMALCFLLTACEYDNYEEPKSVLSGKIIYNGQPVGVRTNGTQLELWQDGFQLRTSIPVYISHDGSYSASLFDGTYKLVRKGNSPWLQQSTDTILVEVKGNTQKDIPVTPYFTVTNENFQFVNNTFTANFVINKIVATANVDAVALFIGKSILTDQNQKELRVALTTSSLVLGANTSITTQLPASLSGLSYVYARIGVKATATGEYSYTQVQKIALK